MSSEKLDRPLRIICDSDPISEKELTLQWLAPAFNIDAPDLNPYPLKFKHPSVLENLIGLKGSKL
jgi:hypothetical protein